MGKYFILSGFLISLLTIYMSPEFAIAWFVFFVPIGIGLLPLDFYYYLKRRKELEKLFNEYDTIPDTSSIQIISPEEFYEFLNKNENKINSITLKNPSIGDEWRDDNEFNQWCDKLN